MITLGTDVADLILQRTLYDNTLGLNSAIERMTSGYKVNHAKDNAAGYSIITNLNTKISSMLQVQQNASDGLSMLQTAEGGLELIEELLQRLRKLAMQASDGSYDTQSRDAMQAEADEIIEQIAQIRDSIEFNGMNLYEIPAEGASSVASAANKAINRLARAAKTSTNTISYDIYPSVAPAVQTSEAELSTDEVPSIRAADIEGAESFASNETKTIVIDGVEYTIKNRQAITSDLSYTKDNTTGEITFIGNYFEIRGQTDAAHNIVIQGVYNYVYGGDLDDKIETFNSSSVYNRFYGGKGNDTLTAKASSTYLYGEDGNDILNIEADASFPRAFGGAGDDTFNIYINSNPHFPIEGNDGDDIFNLYGSNPSSMTIDGGAGINTVTGNRGTATLINVVGANAGTVDLVSGVEQTINIGGIDYTVSTKSATGQLVYKINNSGQIEFSRQSGSIVVKGDENKKHNVKLNDGIIFYGGNMGDTINAEGNGDTAIYCGSGNNKITSRYSYIYCGAGNNEITATYYNSIYSGTGVNNVILTQYGNYVEGGNGTLNVTVKGSQNTLYAEGGNNSVTLNNNNYNLIYGFGDADNAQGVKLAPSGTQTVDIDGVSYEVQNRISSHSTAMLYSKNPVTGELTLGGRYITIYGQKDVKHNVNVIGFVAYFYGGDLDDTITLNAISSYIYGEGGNDTIVGVYGDNIHGGDGDDILTGTSIYGDAGNDIITVNKAGGTVNGGTGDDTYNIDYKANISDDGGNNIYNINTDNASISGGSGNDTFYVTGNNNTIFGGGGDDYFVVDGDNNQIDGGTGNNYYIINGSGTSFSNVSRDPNTGGISFTYSGEVKTFTLNGKTYTVTNNLSGSNMLQYSLNPNTGVITLNGSNFKIDSALDESAILNLRGDNNIVNGSNLDDRITVEQGSNNIINGLSGDDSLTMNSANNSINGDDGNDTITLNTSTNLSVTAGTGNDILNINSDNNTNIDAGGGNNRITVSGVQNNITADNGNNTITVNKDSNTVTAGDGNNRFVITGSSNVITAGGGANSIGIQGDNNNLTAQNAAGTINIYGNSNTVTNTRGENEVVVKGNGNNYTTMLGDKDITVNGDNNELLTGSGNDKIEIKGDGNIAESVSGENEFSVRGDGNTIQGGSDVDNITINGNNNSASGGDSSDSFMISAGRGNIVDGETGERNTIINNGTGTVFSNAVDITPRPFEVNIKVDIGSGDNKFIHTQISFNLFDFSVDFSSQESARESLEDIDSLLENIQSQILNIGTTINRLENVLEAQTLKIDNLISTRSTMRDADIAEESSSFIKYQILQQASAVLMESSRNLRYENVIGLLSQL